MSGFSEEELLFESDEPMVSVEIGHGSVLIKHPSSLAREEESEATSFSVENKSSAVNNTYSCPASVHRHNHFKGDNVCYQGSENFSKLAGKTMHQEPAKRYFPEHHLILCLTLSFVNILRLHLHTIINPNNYSILALNLERSCSQIFEHPFATAGISSTMTGCSSFGHKIRLSAM